MKSWYNQVYLKSSHWKCLRILALTRDSNKCTKCGSSENLNVHHVKYKQIYDVGVEDLSTLCKTCHLNEHNKKPNIYVKPDRKLVGLEVFVNKYKNIYKLPENVWDVFITCMARRPNETEARVARRAKATIKRLKKMGHLTPDINLKLSAMRAGKIGRRARTRLGTTIIHNSPLTTHKPPV